jgi:hypothetical protein
LDATDTYTAFSSLASSKLQIAVDAVQSKVLAKLPNSSSSVAQKVRYRGGLDLNLSSAYLHANGHHLEAAVVAAYPKFNRLNGTGKLLMHMIDVVIRNHPSMAPQHLQDILKNLCDAELV